MKTTEEVLSKYKKVFYEDAPQSTGSAIKKEDVKEAMIEYGKQLLIEFEKRADREDDYTYIISKGSVLNIINELK